jgi:hypothetical protein
LTIWLNGKKVQLAVKSVTITLHLCAQLSNLNKELHKSHDILLAQLFCVEASIFFSAYLIFTSAATLD